MATVNSNAFFALLWEVCVRRVGDHGVLTDWYEVDAGVGQDARLVRGTVVVLVGVDPGVARQAIKEFMDEGHVDSGVGRHTLPVAASHSLQTARRLL